MDATSLAPLPEKRTGEAPGGAPGRGKRQSDYKRSDFTLREHPDGWALNCVGRRGAVLHVVHDATYPEMWRIRHPGGQLSDMVNLTRAKDAAMSVAMRALNRDVAATVTLQEEVLD
jgi:hypothetical protein